METCQDCGKAGPSVKQVWFPVLVRTVCEICRIEWEMADRRVHRE